MTPGEFANLVWRFEKAAVADGAALQRGDWDQVNVPVLDELGTQLVVAFATAKAEVPE